MSSALRGSSSKAELEKRLDLLHTLGSTTPPQTFLSLLKACIDLKSASVARQIHAHLTLNRVPLAGLLGDYLIVALATCGAIDEALQTSRTLPCRTVFSWTALISSFTNHARASDALELYQFMLRDGVNPNAHTFVSLFKACGSIPDLEQGRRLHHDARSKGFDSDIYVASTLISMYGKGGAIEEAEEVFGKLASQNIVSCNAMLSAYVEQNQGLKALNLYLQMQDNGVVRDQLTSMLALQTCACLAEQNKTGRCTTDLIPMEFGLAAHTEAEMKGFTTDVIVGNTLVSMYGKCGGIIEAEHVFDVLSERTIVSWRAMLSAYVEQSRGQKALQLYFQMKEEGMTEGPLTFAIVLQACASLADRESDLGEITGAVMQEIGKAIHANAHRIGYAQDVFVGSALIILYGKCGAITEAEHVFSALSSPNVVCWNAMLSMYVEQGQGQMALCLYLRMLEEGVIPSRRTFLLALHACVILVQKHGSTGGLRKLAFLEIGQAIHADIRNKGFMSESFVGSMLVNVYGKCGAIVEAEKVFEGISQHTIVSWTAMLSGYIEQGQGQKALLLVEQMQKQHVILNDVALICILQACSLTGNLNLCKHVHFGIVCAGYDGLSPVKATLIHAYGSCASLIDARSFFDRVSERDIVSWNACIARHAEEGNFSLILEMLEKLKFAGVKPDESTFASILAACSHTGHVFKGLEYLESMSKDHGLTPDVKHFGSMLHLLGRTGELKRVENILSSIPTDGNLIMWSCLLDACQTHGNLHLAKQAFHYAADL